MAISNYQQVKHKRRYKRMISGVVNTIAILLVPDIVYIYALVDPRTNEVFYIGQTRNLHQRILQHINNTNAPLSKFEYVNSILSDGLIPLVVVLDKLVNKNIMYINNEETWYILKAISEDMPLTNATVNGEMYCSMYELEDRIKEGTAPKYYMERRNKTAIMA